MVMDFDRLLSASSEALQPISFTRQPGHSLFGRTFRILHAMSIPEEISQIRLLISINEEFACIVFVSWFLEKTETWDLNEWDVGDMRSWLRDNLGVDESSLSGVNLFDVDNLINYDRPVNNFSKETFWLEFAGEVGFLSGLFRDSKYDTGIALLSGNAHEKLIQFLEDDLARNGDNQW